jgi:hypothetical protein
MLTPIYTSPPYPTTPNSYMNCVGLALLSTNGCLCTLGIRPRPMARRIAFAIFLWFFGRRPVSLECFIRPISVMYSDMIVKFCVRQSTIPL